MKRVNLFFCFSLFVFVLSMWFLFDSYDSLVTRFTGGIVDSAIVNFTIEEVALVNFTVDRVDWGAGYVFENASYSIVDSLGNVINGTLDPVGSGFVIKNIGNLDLALNFSAGKDAGSFIGGTNPSYQYKVSNVDVGACSPPAEFNLDEFYEIPSAGTLTQICENFSVGKSLSFDLLLRIPDNSLIGNLSDEISVSFEQA